MPPIDPYAAFGIAPCQVPRIFKRCPHLAFWRLILDNFCLLFAFGSKASPQSRPGQLYAHFSLVGIVRKGRPDLIASISLVTILLSLGLAAASDDTRVLQIRESYITLIMGVVFVVSSMVRKPILWLLAKHQAKSEEHRAALEHPQRKKMLGTEPFNLKCQKIILLKIILTNKNG
jgi:hypothetical protein